MFYTMISSSAAIRCRPRDFNWWSILYDIIFTSDLQVVFSLRFLFDCVTGYRD